MKDFSFRLSPGIRKESICRGLTDFGASRL